MAYATQSKYKVVVWDLDGQPREASWRVRGRPFFEDDGCGVPNDENLAQYVFTIHTIPSLVPDSGISTPVEAQIIERETGLVLARWSKAISTRAPDLDLT